MRLADSRDYIQHWQGWQSVPSSDCEVAKRPVEVLQWSHPAPQVLDSECVWGWRAVWDGFRNWARHGDAW